MRWNKEDRIVEQLFEICQVVLGLNACGDFRATVRMVQNSLGANEEFLQAVFEVDAKRTRAHIDRPVLAHALPWHH